MLFEEETVSPLIIFLLSFCRPKIMAKKSFVSNELPIPNLTAKTVDILVPGYIREELYEYSNDFLEEIIKIVRNFMMYVRYCSQFSPKFRADKIRISKNGLEIHGYSTVRLIDPISKGYISNIKLQCFNYYSQRDYYFYGLCSDSNSEEMFRPSSYYPYNGKFDDIYGICSDENSIVTGTCKRATKDIKWKKPIIPNHKVVNIEMIFNYTNDNFILITHIMNGKEIYCHEGDYTFRIDIKEKDKDKKWYPVVSQLGCSNDWCRILVDD